MHIHIQNSLTVNSITTIIIIANYYYCQ